MTWLPLIPQVSARILAMLQKGELDQATALKLLGQNAPDTQMIRTLRKTLAMMIPMLVMMKEIMPWRMLTFC